MINNFPAAVNAVDRGFWVFPVEPGDKVPLQQNGYPIRWSDFATRDIPTITRIWTRFPDANVGIACRQSGLLVVDCDEGPGKDGINEYRKICAQLRLGPEGWDTYSVTTGGGGLHLYFKWPPDVLASQSSLSKDVDVRTNGGQHGGYVLGAGSVTDKGSYRVEYDRTVAQCPPALVELVRHKEPSRPIRDIEYFRPQHSSFAGLTESVRFAQEGNRNFMLFWASRCMCADGYSQEEAYAALSEAALDSGLESREVIASIASAYRIQRQKV